LKSVLVIFVVLFYTSNLSAQNNFIRTTGFFSILHPLVTVSSQETIVNFRDYYVVGFPFGANFWKTSKMAFSIEMIPMIKAENGSSKMYNVLFHPGLVFDVGNGYRISARAAFETAGRYGFTPVFTKTIYKAKNNSYYLAFGLPARFGNDKVASIGTALQIGTSFNTIILYPISNTFNEVLIKIKSPQQILGSCSPVK